MAFRCMNCNGNMTFDVESQSMRCAHCGSECAPGDFVVRDTSMQTEEGAFVADGGMALFTCQSCGAALEGTEESLIGHCPYCGGQSLLKTAGSDTDVEHLVPFKVSKDRCVELYQNYTKRVPYLPKELRSPEYIQNFTGIYMPFHQYDVEFGDILLAGKKTVKSTSTYDYVNHYEVKAMAGPYERGVAFDASRYLDDEISDWAQPFDTSLEEEFHPAYLAGFYADASSVDPELYYPEAEGQAADDVIYAMGKELKSKYKIDVTDESKAEARVTGHHLALMPLWFLTWRKEDRVAYAVINGQSGKVVSDMPVDAGRFALGCAIVSAIVFAVLELFFQPTPMVTSLVSLMAALLMAYGINMSARREFERYTHANDVGWTGEKTTLSPEKLKEKREKRKKEKREAKHGKIDADDVVMYVTVSLMVLQVLLFVFGFFFMHVAVRVILCLVIIACVSYVAHNVITWNKVVKERAPVIAVVALLAAIALNSVIVCVTPVNDEWYYLGDAVCVVGLVVAAVGMIRTFNISTTRPLPKLFDREEV